jgi:hypothetical protein
MLISNRINNDDVDTEVINNVLVNKSFIGQNFAPKHY